MKSVWSNTVLWVIAAVVAVVLALLGPTEASVMGKLPTLQTRFLDQRPLSLPEGLASERTLALISFHRSHREDVESWIRGLGLGHDSAIGWVRLPIVHDPGDEARRAEIASRLRASFGQDVSAAPIAPVFTDRAAFVRAAGLSGIERPHAVVVSRRGQVLARVEGPFDPVKAANLLAALRE